MRFARAVIADYQPVVAHAAIDAGADLIVGHHPHILKGVEIYNEKPIFYSLGNFAFDGGHKVPTNRGTRRGCDCSSRSTTARIREGS